MSILIRFALNCGLFCLLWRVAFPGLPLPLPGHGDPFIEVAFLVVSAVMAREFLDCWHAARLKGKDDAFGVLPDKKRKRALKSLPKSMRRKRK